MFSYGLIEFVTYERYKALQQEAERIQLVKLAQQEQSNNRKIFWTVRNWLGGQMIRWGLKLQSDNTMLLPKPLTK